MPQQHFLFIFLFILYRESHYFEDIVKLWIFCLRTIYNFFQVCLSPQPKGGGGPVPMPKSEWETLGIKLLWLHKIVWSQNVIWGDNRKNKSNFFPHSLILPYFTGFVIYLNKWNTVVAGCYQAYILDLTNKQHLKGVLSLSPTAYQILRLLWGGGP